jgi:BASS family bile acid:Na+ symporter
MPSPDDSMAEKVMAWLAAAVHRNILWLLVAAYTLAAFWPGPGLAIRGISLTRLTGEHITAPMLLLALLIFCAASVVRWDQMRRLLLEPGVLCWAVAAVWLVPGLLVSLLGWILPSLVGDYVTGGMMVGMALVAAMPVANSSVAWCQNARGNVALGLGLIVASILLSPLATPQMLNLMGLSLSADETHQFEELVSKFSGTFFIVWVILPAFAGMLANRIVGPETIERKRNLIRLVSAVSLLTLNYANASLAMPDVFRSEVSKNLPMSAVLAGLISVVGMATAWLLARILHLNRSSHVALLFGLSMKHTGLALVLAGEVFHEHPEVILLIVLATLVQHVVAAVADWYLVHYGHTITVSNDSTLKAK